MSKIPVAFAVLFILASTSPNFAAASMKDDSIVSKGNAIDECRAQISMNDHHARLIVEACVARVKHVPQSMAY